MLIAGWHFAAAGIGTSHWCRMSDKPISCKCPHAGEDANDKDTVSRAHCCEFRVTLTRTTPATFDSRSSSSLELAPLVPVAVMAPPDAPSTSKPLAWNVAPPSHGPPVYLKIRTLLI